MLLYSGTFFVQVPVWERIMPMQQCLSWHMEIMLLLQTWLLSCVGSQQGSRMTRLGADPAQFQHVIQSNPLLERDWLRE